MSQRNDWLYYSRADVLAKQGFVVSWNYGTQPSMLNYLRANPWLLAFGVQVLPWEDPPADMSTWPANRYSYSGIGTLQISDSVFAQVLGPRYINVDGSVSFALADGGYVIAPPAPPTT